MLVRLALALLLSVSVAGSATAVTIVGEFDDPNYGPLTLSWETGQDTSEVLDVLFAYMADADELDRDFLRGVKRYLNKLPGIDFGVAEEPPWCHVYNGLLCKRAGYVPPEPPSQPLGSGGEPTVLPEPGVPALLAIAALVALRRRSRA